MTEHEIITTNPARVKRAGNWCEDADEQTEKILALHGYTWDQEMPIIWCLEPLGLSTTLLCLGEPRPKFKARCDEILLRYCHRIYDLLITRAHQVNFTAINSKNFILNKDRKQTRLVQYRMWRDIRENLVDPAATAICDGMMILFSETKNNIMAIHATKYLLTATKLLLGENPAEQLLQDLSAYIRQELEK